MQLVDKNGNIFGAGIEVTGPDGKPKTTGGGGGSPTGPAGGDLSGVYPNPGVVWTNGLPTYDASYYPLSLNPAGYITSAALSGYLTVATAASTYYPLTNPNAYISGITGSMVTSALGYTPYNSTNPSNYITSAALTPYLTSAVAASTYYPNTNPLNFISIVSYSDVTSALGYTPYDSSNPNNYIDSSALAPYLTASDASTTYYPLTNPSSYISGITSGDVTTALGYTPYDSTNPAGYIDSSALGPYLTAATAASTYQPTLVSGTNIKTINGASVLGSGDLTVSGATTWGSITGTLSSQTDLQSALNAKQATLVSGTNIKTVNSTSLLGSGDVAVQPTLVSGTNIKTVNGNSLLGSGDLTISGGGGLQGVHALVTIPTGFNFGYSSSLTALNSNQPFNTNQSALILAPFIPARNITYTSLKINVTTATPSCLTKILFYSDSNGLPSTKLFESSSIDCSTTGNKTITVTGTFNAGTTYWIGTHANNNCVLSGIPVGSALSIGLSIITAGHITGWNYAYTFNTAPATLNQAQRTNWTGPTQLIQILP